MKKILAMIMAMVLCLGLLSCGGDGNSSEIKNLKITDNGYCLNDGYLYYMATVENPNAEKVAELPTVRITAKDSEGNVISTSDGGFMEIYPKSQATTTGMIEVSAEPSSVDFEVLTDNYTWINLNEATYAETPNLKAENYNLTVDDLGFASVSGNIVNGNSNEYDTVQVSIVCKDDNNNVIACENTYINHVAANGNTPFTLDMLTTNHSNNYQIYVIPW